MVSGGVGRCPNKLLLTAGTAYSCSVAVKELTGSWLGSVDRALRAGRGQTLGSSPAGRFFLMQRSTHEGPWEGSKVLNFSALDTHSNSCSGWSTGTTVTCVCMVLVLKFVFPVRAALQSKKGKEEEEEEGARAMSLSEPPWRRKGTRRYVWNEYNYFRSHLIPKKTTLGIGILFVMCLCPHIIAL